MSTVGILVKSDFNAPYPVDPAKSRVAFGQRLLQARLEFGARAKPPRQVGQAEIAEAMGVTKGTVSKASGRSARSGAATASA